MGKQHFCFSKKYIASIIQCKVESRQDPGLCLGIEIHENISADEQVDPRDGWVANQVVTSEDDGATELDAKNPAAELDIVPVAAAGLVHPQEHFLCQVRGVFRASQPGQEARESILTAADEGLKSRFVAVLPAPDQFRIVAAHEGFRLVRTL